MHVCYLNLIIEFYSPVSGGAISTCIMQQSRRLIERGHQVTVLTRLNGDPVYDVGRIVPVQVTERHMLSLPLRVVSKLQVKLNAWDFSYYKYYRESFTRQLQFLKPAPDAVILHNDLTSPRYVRRALPHAKVFVRLSNEVRTRQRDLRPVADCVDAFLVVSQYIKDWTCRTYRIDPDKVHVVPNGADVEEFRPRPGFLDTRQPVRILFLGRFTHDKGPDLAVEAFGCLKARGLCVELDVAGGIWFHSHGNDLADPYFRSVKEQMDATGATYLGHIPRVALPGVIADHDIVCVPSRWNDPMPQVLFEAMACGCAVVASNRGGIPEACGDAAILIDPERPEQLVDALAALVTDPQALARHKAASIQRAASMTWSDNVDRLEEILTQVARMKVAIFASRFYPHFGGVEELCRQLAHELARQECPAMVATNRWPKDLPKREEFEGLDVRRYVFRVPERAMRAMGGAILYGPATLRRLCADLREAGTDVLHVQCVSSNAYYALKASHRLGLPLVVTLQGELTMDATGLFQRSAFARRMLRSVLKNADAVTACSQKTLDDAEAFYGQRLGPRARVIFNGARIDDFAGAAPWPHPRPYVFAIGRLVSQKGFDVLLRAMACGSGSSYDLLLAGDGPERDALHRLCAQLGVEQRVTFLGRVDHLQAASLYGGCELVVVPSRADEGLPVVCAEAMASGKPTIGARVGGVPEAVVPERTGLIVAPEDPAALAGAIGRLMSDAPLRRVMGQAARQRAGLFAWPVIARQYRDVYGILTASRRTPAVQGRSACTP